MLQIFISFYFWNQNLCLKIKSYFDQIWKKTTSTPSTFGKCSSLVVASMMLNFWKNVLHLLN
jgi:hypothetical protein